MEFAKYPIIDAVITWVDTENQEQVDLRNFYANSAILSKIPVIQNQDEIKYLLRSIEMNAPWINHIYIVSCTGAPKWLDNTHPEITIVDQSEIFLNSKNLPIFNPVAIESQIHHIPELCEYFFLIDDDMFFANTVNPSDFIAPDGRAYARLHGDIAESTKPSANDYENMWCHTRDLIQRSFGFIPKLKIAHQATILRKSVCEDLEKLMSDAFQSLSGSRFRGGSQVMPTGLEVYYGLHTNRFTYGKEISELFLQWENTHDLTPVFELRPKLLCINNIDTSGVEKWFEFANAYFPKKSRFEKNT